MKNQKLLLISAILYVLSVNAQFSVDGEFRTRFSVLHGYKTPALKNSDAAFSFDQRSRLSFNYKNEKYITKFTLQDARVWGSDDSRNPTGIEGNTYSFGIYEAWVDLKLNDNNRIRIGRQEWNYNDMRILCHRNWWTSALSYDALLYKYKNNNLSVDLGISYNNDGTIAGNIKPWVQDAYRLRTMNFLNIEKKFSDKLTTAIMFSLAGRQDTASGRTNNLLAIGTHGIFAKYNYGKKAEDGVFAGFSGYYQHGSSMARVRDLSTYKSISAYLISAELGYRMMNKKMEIAAGIELVSGNDAKDTTESYNNVEHSYDLLNSARFPYYSGNLIHYLVSGSKTVGTAGGGLTDPYFKISYKPAKKNKIALTVWLPSLGTNVIKETGTNGEDVYYDKSLGTYFDLHFVHKFSKDIILKSGFSYAIVSDTKNHLVYGYEDAVNKELYELGNTYFFWAMIIIKPNFFDSSKLK